MLLAASYIIKLAVFARTLASGARLPTCDPNGFYYHLLKYIFDSRPNPRSLRLQAAAECLNVHIGRNGS
jgi:hypothetical protein